MTDGRNDLLTEGMTETPNVVIAQPKGCAIRKSIESSGFQTRMNKYTNNPVHFFGSN